MADYITHSQSDLPVSDLSGLLLLFVYFTSLETSTDNNFVFQVQRCDTFHSLSDPPRAAQESVDERQLAGVLYLPRRHGF